MPFAELALLFSLLSIFMLGLSGWYNFRKLWLNLAPYVSIILAFWFYYLGDDGIEFEFDHGFLACHSSHSRLDVL